MDWGLGSYEHVAVQLAPAAQLVVERARPAAGERVVDVGCGTGNATLLAAAAGARVTGVDPAPRLLEVARRRAAAQGLMVSFVRAGAEELPLADGTAEVILSVFGVIFAADPHRAAAEMARVVAPCGRIALCAWLPGGALGAAARLARDTIGRATDAPGGPPPFPWHDADALGELWGPHGFGVTTAVEELAFTAGSPQEYLEGDWANHPLVTAARGVLGSRQAAELRARTLSIYAAANEDPDRFRVTSRYVVALIRR